MHGSLQVFSFGLFRLFSTVFECFYNAWNARFDSDSNVPLVFFSDDAGLQKISCSCLVILGCWRALGHPSGPHRASMAQKDRKKTGKKDRIGDNFGDMSKMKICVFIAPARADRRSDPPENKALMIFL